MIYKEYKVKTDKDFSQKGKAEDKQKFKDSISEGVREYNALINKKDYRFFLTDIKHDSISVVGCIGYRTKEEIRKELLSFLETLGFSHFTGEITEEEITTRSFAVALRDADKKGFLINAEQTCVNYTMSTLRDSIFNVNYEEDILEGEEDEDQIFFFNSVEEEKKRIFSPASPQDFIGHPVHYIVMSKDKEVRENMIGELLGALLKAGRIKGRRLVKTSIINGNINKIYEFAKGCTVVLEIDTDIDSSDIFYFLNDDVDNAILSSTVEEHRNDVLSVFSIDPDRHGVLKEIIDSLEGVNFVVLKEDLIYGEEAKKHLKAIARHDKTTEIPGLVEKVKSGEGYTYSGLNAIYKAWKDEMVSASFPAYSSFTCQNEEAKKEAKGDAYKKLKSLIGLDRTKEIIDEAIAFNKMQSILLNRNIVPMFPCRHMVFYGAPGTAKTTVARLYAEILKDNGALSEGKLIEVGRKDLVGKYVGWTAKQVEDIFKKAKGNVLFIDEAYSLVDGRDKLYGQEAINTIVQMMENMRDDVVVIFAGYEKEMEEFLNQNPGLMSRIPFHVHFDNYSETELWEILSLMATEMKYTIAPGTKEKVLPIFREAMGCKDFGNGRFARNMIERAVMKRASRLSRSYSPDISDSELMTLRPEDFSAPDKITSDHNSRFMGFTA